MLADTDEETDADDVGVDKPVKEFVTVTVFVTPVGKVDSDAVPVLKEEDDAVRLAPLLTLDEGELVLECVDVRDDVVELEIVAVTLAVPVIRVDDDEVTDVVGLLLGLVLPVPVGESDEDFEDLAESVPVAVYLRERERAAERVIVGDFVMLAVAVV